PPSRPPRSVRSFPTRRSSDLLLQEVLHGGLALERLLDRLLHGGPIVAVQLIEIGVLHSGETRIDPHQGDDAETLGLVLRYDAGLDRKSTRLNSSHVSISYAVF